MKRLVTTIALAFTLSCYGDEPADKPIAGKDTQAALNYLKQLSKGDVDLEKHTALSPHCGIQRRKTIQERIGFLQKNNFRQGDTFSVESTKVNNHLAAILVRATNPEAPLSDRIHAVALVQQNEVWKPAPLPGSFANTGYGYDEKIELTVHALERWMAREKILLETQTWEKASTEFKATIAAIEKKAGLDTMSPEEAITHFLKQCREKNLLGILASMGAASNQLLEPLETTIDIVSQGLSNKPKSSDWHLMTDRSVIAQVLKVDHKRNEVALGFLNSLKHNKSKILYFPIHKSGGKTFVRLAPMLKVALLPENERRAQRWRHHRGDENDLRKKLPATILKNSRPVSYPTPQKLREHFLRSVKNNDFSDAIRLLPRKGDYFGKEENQASTLTSFGALWHSIRILKSPPLPASDILQEKSIALAPLQYAKLNRPGELQTIKIWMINDTDGWHIIGQDPLNKTINDTLKATSEKLDKRFTSIEKNQQEKHARDWLNKVVTLTPPITLDPVEENVAKTLFSNFRTHLRAKDIASALSSCAVLKETNNTQTLKIFNYAIRGAADHIDDDQLLGITRAGKWLGVSVRTKSKLTKTNDYPLYLVVNTNDGPKILLDIDLRHAINKGRELLNKKSWRKLEQSLPKESLVHIKTLFTQHGKLTTTDIEKLLKTHE
jgi:hypothetical protein